jgi:hypothetical protein
MISSSHDGVISQKARENTNGDRYEEVAVTAQRGRRSLGESAFYLADDRTRIHQYPSQAVVSE